MIDKKLIEIKMEIKGLWISKRIRVTKLNSKNVNKLAMYWMYYKN